MQNRENPKSLERVLELDRKLRANIADYYMALKEFNQPAKAVELIADHVAILVEMINDFKKS